MSDELPLSWLRAQHSLDLRPVGDTHVPGAGFSVIQPTELTDPREFLQPHAVVLTVGVALTSERSGEDDPFPAYVRRLADAEVTAVGFGTGLFFPTVPSSLVDAARDHGIAVFEVPRHTAFISILNTVLEERERRSRRDQEHLVVVQEQLSAAAVDGGLEALLDATASQLDAAVAVTDNDGRVHGRRNHGDYAATTPARGQLASGADHTDGVWRLTQRMTLQGERFHLITVAAAHPFSPHDRSVVKHAAGLADILLQRPAYLRRSRTELNTLALQLLLGIDGENRSMGGILDEASDSDGQVRPVVVAADRHQELDKALADADRRAARTGRHMFVTGLDAAPSTAALLLFRGSRSVDSIADSFGDTARAIRIAVGEPVAWSDVTMERVRRLETAARSLTPGSHVGPYEAGTDWLEQTAVRSALDQRAAETVDRLAGGGTGDDLSTTLLTWLRSGGKIAATAEALGVHRHTVRTRLDRIAQICEVDLDDPVVRAELLLVAVTRR
ncbi:helix-turn-helix domain-containing protein [Corynebacterium sp. USCH3]|uniref:PucR family transcriptional regulator n=1 Tax=Corynebacterium sp. USCH3 TaxID=3024840 RepID=UPI0030B28C12